jgi:hypothetical protein
MFIAHRINQGLSSKRCEMSWTPNISLLLELGSVCHVCAINISLLTELNTLAHSYLEFTLNAISADIELTLIKRGLRPSFCLLLFAFTMGSELCTCDPFFLDLFERSV